MNAPFEPPHGFVTLDRLFAQPNLPAQEFHIHMNAPATTTEAEAELTFHVFVADDLCIGTDDPLATSLLDTFIEEARPLMIVAYYVTEEDPDRVTLSTWLAAEDRIEGWSKTTQAEIAEHAGDDAFNSGALVSGSAWPAKYGGLVV